MNVKSIADLLGEVELSTPNRQQAKELKAKELTAKQRLNAEVDSYLDQLISNGYVKASYRPWYGKLIYTLGIQEVNNVLLQVMNASNVRSPESLFNYKCKAILLAYYKRQYEQEL